MSFILSTDHSQLKVNRRINVSNPSTSHTPTPNMHIQWDIEWAAHTHSYKHWPTHSYKHWPIQAGICCAHPSSVWAPWPQSHQDCQPASHKHQRQFLPRSHLESPSSPGICVLERQRDKTRAVQSSKHGSLVTRCFSVYGLLTSVKAPWLLCALSPAAASILTLKVWEQKGHTKCWHKVKECSP